MSWSDYQWIPPDRRLPTLADGKVIASGTKVAVLVLTVEMMLNGWEPEERGFHVAQASFDDDDEGKHRVVFWAPCPDAVPEGQAAQHAQA
jgi:hypothetical protein